MGASLKRVKIVCALLLLLASGQVLAGDLVSWKLKKHVPDRSAMTREIADLTGQGYVPVGLAALDEVIYILYLKDPEIHITSWRMNSYESFAQFKGDSDLMVQKGYTPSGITFADGLVLAIYIRCDAATRKWQIQDARSPAQFPKASIGDKLTEQYVPAGMGFIDDTYRILLTESPEVRASSWRIESFAAGGAELRSGIDAQIKAGRRPWGMTFGRESVDIVFIDFTQPAAVPRTDLTDVVREVPRVEIGDDTNPMRPVEFAKVASEFRLLARSDPPMAGSLFMSPRAEEQFEPVHRMGGGTLCFFFAAAIPTIVYTHPYNALVLYYDPWSDVALITSWGVLENQCMIVDSELVCGDFIRRAGTPPFDTVPKWQRISSRFPPHAAMKAASSTFDAFSKLFGESLPGNWRLEMENGKDPDILVAGNVAAIAMLTDRIEALHILTTSKRWAPLRSNAASTMQLLTSDRLDTVLARTNSTHARTGELLRRVMTGNWDRSSMLAATGVEDGAMFISSMPDYPTRFISFSFSGKDGKDGLKRIDVFSFQAPPGSGSGGSP